MDNQFVDNEDNNSIGGEEGQEKVQLSTSKRKKAKWDDATNLIFVELCEEEVRKGNRPGTYLSKDGWKNLVKEFNKRARKNYTRIQLKNHWDNMKKEWRLFKNLMRGETGLGFDATRNTISVDDKWWEDKIKVNEDYKKFRGMDLSLLWYRYDALFSDIVATGERARAPSEIGLSVPHNGAHASQPSTSNDLYVDEADDENIEGNDFEDLLYETQNLGGVNDGFRDAASLFPSISNLTERPRASTSGKKRKTSRAAALKEDIHSLIDLISSKNSTPVVSQDNPTVTQCMDILKNLPGIDIGTGLWFYGCNLLAKKEQREIFIGQPTDELKLAWLGWNYNEYCNKKI